jgi:membrane protein implicated in regulation of membrane protease activity
MNPQWWSWILTGMGLTCFILAGRKVWWSWYVALTGQALWLVYALATWQLGFVVGVVAYTVVYGFNARDSTLEQRARIRNAKAERRGRWAL